ncbi:23S rRNA (adenine(2503)-C(2))-methyltransferase RlmN [Candidatus Omnitrophota bacterium]
MQDIKELTSKELEKALAAWKESPYHCRQILSWIYKKGVLDFGKMSDLSAALRGRLKENFYISALSLVERVSSADGTEKFLLRLKDGNLIEAVAIPAKGRLTGCISTQAGCRFACRFCASGAAGFKRNLSCAEIIEQLLFLNNPAENKLSHVVFMGIGEPLDNYENLLRGIRIINSAHAFNIGARRITISTCGIIPGIKRLSGEKLQIELSVSLHAGDDKIRSSLMPVNRKYPLKDLIAACGEYIKNTRRQVTFEYVLIKGINSDLQSAVNLSRILRGLRLCKVNLIPANYIPESKIEPPNKLGLLFFRDHLLKQGIKVTLRKPRGQDITAACGQLRLRHEKK